MLQYIRSLSYVLSSADIFLYISWRMTMIAVYLLSIGIGCVLAMPPNSEPIQHNPKSFQSDGPIKVQMKCSQVTRQVFCRFYFQNTADEDYYILEDNTPLEGLYYPYLTISQGDKVIEYRGKHVYRMAPTKDSYVLIEAGKTITSPVVDLTSSYKFDSDGIYTIEYTKPFMYISNAEMSMIDDNKNLPQATGYDDLVASTEIELRDTYYLKPTDYEVEMANKKFKEKTSLDDDQTVYISHSCGRADFENEDKLPSKDRRQLVDDVTEVHNQLCKVGFPKAIVDATSNSDKAPYINYFGTASNRDVLSVLNEILTQLRRPRRIMTYVFRAPECTFTSYAIGYYGRSSISLCKRFESAPTHAIIRTYGINNHNSKFQILAHEYTHAFCDTDDVRYGYHACRSRIMISSAKAINNADSYGYYIQDVYDGE